MKLFFIIFFIGFQLGFSQSNFAKITYEVNMFRDEISKSSQESQLSDIKKSVLKKLREASPVNSILLFNNNQAKYTIEKKLQDDSSKKFNFLFYYSGGLNVYFTDLNTNRNIVQTNATGTTTRILYEPKEWILTKKTKKIENYICYKAILKNKPTTVAWYCPELPFNHGPKLYNNLPGLILELNVSKSYWIVRKIEFNHADAKNIIEPTEGKLITEEEYREYSKGFFGSKN